MNAGDYCPNNVQTFYLDLVCHVLPGAVLQDSERGTRSNQTSGQVPVCQNGGFRLFLVISSGM